MPPRSTATRRTHRPPDPARGAGVRIAITGRPKAMAVDRRWLAGVVRRAVDALGAAEAEIGIALVDDSAIAAIHERWMGLPDPTDVITFDLSTPGIDGLAGDIVVSVETARRMAKVLGWQPRHELAYYVVHGLLHLAGEDDLEPVDRRRMRTRERTVMAAIGLPSPPRRPRTTGARR